MLKVRLLNDGSFTDLLGHLYFPVIVQCEYLNGDLIKVNDSEFNVTSPDGYFLFYRGEYEELKDKY